MGPLDLFIHLLSFAAPALVVALLVTLAAPLLLPKGGRTVRWRTAFVLNFTAGLATLLAGLWVFGVDGKMATYAALLVVVASTQWLVGRAWR